MIEACWHHGTILRATILDKIIDTWYPQMSKDQRHAVYSFFMRQYGDDEKTERQKRLLARFDPKNQYDVVTEYEGNTQSNNAYLFEGKYFVGNNTYIEPKCILTIEAMK